jgi:hypothetical protein
MGRLCRLHSNDLFRLDREPDGYLGGSVKYLKQVIAQQAVELAFGSRAADELNSAIASATFGTDDFGPSHQRNMRKRRSAFPHLSFFSSDGNTPETHSAVSAEYARWTAQA